MEGVTADQAARALARIMLAACYQHHVDVRDTMAKHFLHMRKHQITPVSYAARIAHTSEAEMLELAKGVLESERLEQAVMPGSSWTPDNLSIGVAAITSLAWTDQTSPRSSTSKAH